MAFDFKIRKGAATPLHEQLTNALRESIARLAPGDRLPSENALRKKYNLSRLTVARALNALEQEGYLKRVRGSGSFVDNPTPIHIYYLLPCLKALRQPDLFLTMDVYAGVLARAARYGCRVEALIASSVNIAWELNHEVISGLPRGSRLVIFGSWLRDIFSTVCDCGHHVAYVDIQAENGPETLARIAGWWSVTVDRRGTVGNVMDRLAAAGRRRIALIHNYSHYRNPCFCAYREALERHHIPLVPELVIYSSDDELSAQYAVRHLLDFRREFPFDAVVAAGGNLARGVVTQLQRNHFLVPEEVAVVSLNHPQMKADDEFAQIVLPFQEAGELAVEHFCHHVEEPVSLTGTLQVPEDSAWNFLHQPTKEVQEWNVGKSFGPFPAPHPVGGVAREVSH